MTDAYRNEAIELERYKPEMGKLRDRRDVIGSQLVELENRRARSESQVSAIENIEAFCDRVSAGLDSLSAPERRELLRLLVERITVKEGHVRVETVIPTDGGGAGILCTRHPELDSESRVLLPPCEGGS